MHAEPIQVGIVQVAHQRKGAMLPDGEDVEMLALFLDRAAQLKMHFQEVLFLEPETKMVDVIVLNRRGIARIVAEGAAPSVPAEVELELENGGPELVTQP